MCYLYSYECFIANPTHLTTRVQMTSTNNQQAIDLKVAIKELNDHAPNITFLIVCERSDAQDLNALNMQSTILRTAHGDDLFNALKKHTQSNASNSALIGVTSHQQKSIFSLKPKLHWTALIYLNAKDKPAENLQSIYALGWRAINLIKNTKAHDEHIINIPQTPTENMLADAFAGTILELKGNKGALKTLAKIRSRESFETSAQNETKNPFPILYETSQMVIEDLRAHYAESRDTDINAGLAIIEETRQTIDDNLPRQWDAFIEPAREMAHAGISIPQILGAAIYTSDNVYNRANARTIAELLNTDPAPIIDFNGYNAFADTDSQHRSHKLACLETHEYIQSQTNQPHPIEPSAAADIYFQTAQQMTDLLLQGKPSGWCAPALIILGKTIKETPDISKQLAAEIFSMEINAIAWDDIRKINLSLNALKSKQDEITISDLIELLRQDETTRETAILIKELSQITQDSA